MAVILMAAGPGAIAAAAQATVRPAKLADRDRFLSLMHDYLVELLPLGSEILPTERTLSTFGWMFDNFVAGICPGAVVVCAHGFSMAGQPSDRPLFDTTFGQMAYGQGTYVEPGWRQAGLAGAMRARLRDELRRLGFRAISGAAHHLNGAGIESVRSLPFKWHQVTGIEEL